MSFPSTYAGAPTPIIPSTRVPFGNTNNLLTSASNFYYVTDTLTVPIINLSSAYTDNGMTTGSVGYSTTTKVLRATDEIGDGALRKVIDPSIVDGTLINTTTETAFYSTSIPIPANSVIAKRVLKEVLYGIISSAAVPTGTLTIRVKLGSVTILTLVTPALLGALANSPWTLDLGLVCQTSGASGTFSGYGRFQTVNAATGASFGSMAVAHNVSVDTTSAINLTVTAQLSSTDTAANSLTAYGRVVEV